MTAGTVPDVHQDHSPSGGSDFARLTRELTAAGLLGRRRGHYTVRMSINVMLLALGVAVFVTLGESWWQLANAAFLAFVFTQFAFVGHDAGHRQIFRRHANNDLVGYTHGAVTGISYRWWVNKHNKHHANPNHEDHDPDIEIPALAFSREQARSKRGPYRWITRHQAWLFFPLLTVEAVMLRLSSLRAIRRREVPRPRLEAVLQVVPLAGYVTALLIVLSPLQALLFVVVHQALMGVYLGCSFAPNHKGMPVIEAGERLDHLRKQVLTSRNVSGGRWVDGLLGGLNHQIEHHLYPHMPRPNLRRAQPIVQSFCERQGIPYSTCGLRASYAEVLRHLHDAGAPLRRADEAVARSVTS
ncbi:MAG TPA: acyl-CoA desaturase [Pseudonocardiaceae bacterium]